MAASNIPEQTLPDGRSELEYTKKRTLVVARRALASLMDVVSQAIRGGMLVSMTTIENKGRRFAVVALGLPAGDVVATLNRRTGRQAITADGRDITDPAAWEDCKEVMAELEGEK